MGYLAGRRIAAWSQGMYLWAAKRIDDNKDGRYAYGVAWAIGESKGNVAPISASAMLKRYGEHVLEGCLDTRFLINEVLADGVAPPGAYIDLLADAHRARVGRSEKTKPTNFDVQTVWNESIHKFGEVFAAFEKADSGDLSDSNPEYMASRLISAHYGFLMLANAGVNEDITRPLAEATISVYNALDAGDSDAIVKGMTRASEVAAGIVDDM